MGAASSKSPPIFHPLQILPGSLLQTNDLPSDDHDCPICREPLRKSSVQHYKCGRCFHHDCLRQWLLTADTCPICRANIGFQDIWAINEADRVEYVRQFRASRYKPSEYYAMSSVTEIVDMIKARHPQIEKKDILKSVRDEITLADNMLDCLGDSNGGALTISQIMDTDVQYKDDESSVRNFFIASRLLGVNYWYLARFKHAPDIGYWIPVVPKFEPMDADEDDISDDLLRFYNRTDTPPNTLQVPLSVSFIRDFFGLRHGIRHRTSHVTRLRSGLKKIEKKGNSYCFIFDLPGKSTSRGPRLFLIPWPRGWVNLGLKTLAYPHYSRRSLPQLVLGWKTDADTAMLEHAGTATDPGCTKRFHEECLISWFRSSAQDNPSCPIDRKPVLQPDELNPWEKSVEMLLHYNDMLQDLFLTDHAVAARLLDKRDTILELRTLGRLAGLELDLVIFIWIGTLLLSHPSTPAHRESESESESDSDSDADSETDS